MIGMNFGSFLVLLVVGALVAFAYHNVFRYRVLEGSDALVGKVIIGWLGAWLGSPVFGHWLGSIGNVYLVPAILGAIASVHLITLAAKLRLHMARMRFAAMEGMREEPRASKPAIAA